MTSRHDKIRQSFTKEMRLIEIGASYNPIVPKRDGWRTTVVDHADRETLVKKYHGEGDRLGVVGWSPEIIEEVDVVWSDGPLLDAFPETLHGSFDGAIASHVGEHVPDLVGFLQAMGVLLKPTGTFFLALPDRRLCFDFFQSITTTGNVLDGMGQSRHSRGTIYDHSARYTRCNGLDTWFTGGRGGTFSLAHTIGDVRGVLDQNPTGEYVDCHKWRFTPASFEQIILDLNLLRLIPWTVARIERQEGIEFFVWLERGEIEPTAEIEQWRLQLLQETVMETKEQIALIEPAPEPEPEDRRLTISAIIPLYNGAKFIGQSVSSILHQTLPPDEIIVVDDGSTDDGASVVAAMIREHPQIKLLTKANGGQSSARNFGVAQSTGDLIALLDQDDMWYPHHLEELIKPFEETSVGPELGWVYSDLDEVDTEGRMINHRFLRTLPTPHPKRNLFECLREDMFVLPSASLISRKAFDAVGGFDERLSGYEDDDLFLRLFRAGYGNVFLEIPLSKWRIYPESSSYSYRMRRSRAVYVRKLMEEYKDDPDRHRFLKRDILVPRFYGHALAEFLKAVKLGNAADIAETRQELVFMVGLMPGRKRQVFGQVLTRMQSPRSVRMVYNARTYLRPLARRLF